jgi:glycosyltransferase involved in cell wall biosynthesis
LPGFQRGYGLSSAYTLFALPIAKMIRRLKSVRPDVVHGHGTEGPFSLTAVLSGFPNIVSLQGIVTEIVKISPSLEYSITGYLERYTLRRAMAINAKTKVSENFAKLISPRSTRYFIEASIDNIYWDRPIPGPARNIFFVGSIIKRKGIEEWINAFSLLSERWPDIKGYLVGSGHDRYVAYLKHIIASKPVKLQIEFTGQLKREEIVQLFSKGGIFCLPSYVENSPNTIMEAMAAGLPVVATDVGNVSQMVEHQNNGLLVETCSVDGIKEALSVLLTNLELYTRAARLGREIASQRWKPSIIAQKHLAMYDELLRSI